MNHRPSSSSSTTGTMLRGPRPKLTLSVPAQGKTSSPTGSSGCALTLAIPTSFAGMAPLTPRSPLLASATSIKSACTPLTQAARNALLNQQGKTTLQVPSFAYSNSHLSAAQSILKRDVGTRAVFEGPYDGKSLRFNEIPGIKCISPLPIECHGGYAKMSREDRRWRTSD